MEEVCPFAKRLRRNVYLCLVDGSESPNIFGIHTKRWRECPLYRKGLHLVKAVHRCLVNAAKMDPSVIEKVLENLKLGKGLSEKCDPPKSCVNCVCYLDGKCLLWSKWEPSHEGAGKAKPSRQKA